MKSKRSHEGWMMVDNSAAGEGRFEWAIFTCPHCSRQTKLDPLRQRPRGYCRRCDRYVCDSAACNDKCGSLREMADALREGRLAPGSF